MAAEALEKSALESKDKEQLTAIAEALGVKAPARATKAILVEKILEKTGGSAAPAKRAAKAEKPAEEESADESAEDTDERPARGDRGGRNNRNDRGDRAERDDKPAKESSEPIVYIGADGEPLAEWEIELAQHEGRMGELKQQGGGRNNRNNRNNRGDREDRGDGEREERGPRQNNQQRQQGQGQNRQQNQNQGQRNEQGGDWEDRGGRNSRRRRRGRNGRDEGPQGDDRYDTGEQNENVSTDPVKVEGYLDLRDEGYGFLRIGGYQPTREDAYIPVKLTRQFGLRKGDHVTGMSRPAGRNEKNPAMLEIHTVNGQDPEKARQRPRFEDLTPLFPDHKLRMEDPRDPTNMTARIIDLIAPIGKGQRGLIVSPPKAGKTTVMKTIAASIEKNNPEVKLIVLLIDERPEEVTDMRRTVKGEVIASTFDRPSDEHTHIAEMTIEKAKRMVEMGEDVVIILDGITRLSRAYNLSAPASGRIMSGGIDAGALYPPKKFFGSARNIEEGGSLTILATALVETNSRMDEAIFEEFKGTGNMELRLDRRIAERRVFPAIDVDASSTRHEELLFERKQLQLVWKLRRVLSGLAQDGNPAPGLEMLMDRLKTFGTNDEFLAEIAKTPGA
ncbi:MAG: transcription termination factor Rho [Ilumatobacteraceae bacterium]|jgi:transcription termination factor Rho|nr:transcription termination factor Rho [Ilumatobacteraceae bacterium]